MSKFSLLAALTTLTVLSAECSQPPAPTAAAPAPPSLTSGLDASGFDKATRPQDDLFQFVNGGWLSNTEIPSDKPAYGSFYEANDRTQVQLRALVETAAATPGAPGSDQQKIGDFFTAFMDEARADRLGLAPLEPELAAIDALATKSDLAKYFARQMKLNASGSPLGGGVDGDPKNPTESALVLYQAGLGLPDRDYYLKTDPKLKEYRAKYLAYITTMLDAAKVPNAAAAAADILAFETRLARVHWTRVESRDAVKRYNKVALADLPTQFPGMDWTSWATELGVASAQAVVVSQPSFVKAMASMVGTSAGRPLETLSQVPHDRSLCALPERVLRQRTLRLPRAHPARHQRAPTSVEARHHQPRHRRRRVAGQSVRREAFHSCREGSHGRARRKPPRGLSPRHRRPGLDEP